MSEPVLFVLLSRTDSSPCIFFECKQFRAVLFLFALSAMKGFGRRGGGSLKEGKRKRQTPHAQIGCWLSLWSAWNQAAAPSSSGIVTETANDVAGAAVSSLAAPNLRAEIVFIASLSNI